MAKITIEELSDSLKDLLNNSGSEDLSEYQKINDNNLATTDKTIVGAINELFQNANNGKELIADAIGEPLDPSDTFSAMSNDIKGLLSTFKSNMMNAGATVESSDKFKQLIDKIAKLSENSNSGIQYAEGNIGYGIPFYTQQGQSLESNYKVEFKEDLGFTPTIIFIRAEGGVTTNSDGEINFVNGCISSIEPTTIKTSSVSFDVTLDNLSPAGFRVHTVADGGYTTYSYFMNENVHWYAIGVGEIKESGTKLAETIPKNTNECIYFDVNAHFNGSVPASDTGDDLIKDYVIPFSGVVRIESLLTTSGRTATMMRVYLNNVLHSENDCTTSNMSVYPTPINGLLYIERDSDSKHYLISKDIEVNVGDVLTVNFNNDSTNYYYGYGVNTIALRAAFKNE